MTKILITGGTGLIGKQLQKKLQDKSYEVVILSRNPKSKNDFLWNVNEGYIDEKALENTRYIIHLAGAGIADKRWTTERKKELINSRVKSTNLLLKKIKEYQIPLKGFVSASGIGYYGAITSDKIFTEEDDPENDFISEICVEWEKSVRQFQELEIPTTILRTGIVLSKNGGALQKMNTPLFLSALGSGNQFMPWIHIDDLCDLYIKAIENSEFTGIYNAVAPEHQTNQSFTKTLGKVLGKSVLPMNAPSFVLKSTLGELAYILINGSRVSSKKVEESGFQFQFKTLRDSLVSLYSK
jgi:hypothetical protein